MQRAPASIITLLALTFGTVPARAADAQDVTSRAALIQEAEQTKSESLRPAEPDKAEAYVARLSDALLSGDMHWHAFWTNAYSGGGFTLGAGYMRHVSSYNLIDLRGSITPSGYKRIEAQFFAPELFARRGTLSVLGGWREATQVGFYGLGRSSHKESQVNYGFTQPYMINHYPGRMTIVLQTLGVFTMLLFLVCAWFTWGPKAQNPGMEVQSPKSGV